MRSRLLTIALALLLTLFGGAGLASAGGGGGHGGGGHGGGGHGGGHGGGGGGHGGGSLPDVIDLPTGFRPEGVSIGGSTLFVGSVSTGAIFRYDLRTGDNGLLVPAAAAGTTAAAVGTEVDSRGRLWVAGGGTGKGTVYDTTTGAVLAQWQFATPPTATFVNDVVVTRDAAYFTDSRAATLYVVPIGKRGAIDGFTALPLTGELVIGEGNNLNGIEASPDGRTLLAVQSNTGFLFRVDPASGVTSRVDLGGYLLTNGDGLLRDGRTLYVVQNRDNKIVPLELSRSYAAATVGTAITNSAFDVPTTIAEKGDSLFAVNARFGVAAPDTQSYTIVRVPLNR